MIVIEKSHFCPVCGFNFYKYSGELPWNGNTPSDDICPSCGIQFGYEDSIYDEKKRNDIYKKLRENWIKNGMKWWGDKEDMPQNWDPKKQLDNLK